MRWRRVDVPRREVACAERTVACWRIRGEVAVIEAGVEARLRYTIERDPTWHTRSALAEGEMGGDPIRFSLEADEAGNWRRDGTPIFELSGALDKDLGFTPATNTLPIRRLVLGVGESGPVRSAWLRFPELRLEPLEQTYTRETERSFRYRAEVDGKLVHRSPRDGLLRAGASLRGAVGGRACHARWGRRALAKRAESAINTIDKKSCQWHNTHMLELEVIHQPDVAALALDPVKSRILAALSTPGSAASLASRVGLTRQKVNYHLRALEEHHLVEPVEERRWGGLKERRMVATATSYVVSPGAFGPIAADPDRASDRLSASYLIALAARIVREVGEMWQRARKSDKRLATLSLDTVIHFKSPAERASFTSELTSTIAALAARYHEQGAPGARPHRLIVAAYPAPKNNKS